MFRARLPRRLILGAAGTTLLVGQPPNTREKLSIYPEPEQQLVLVDTPSELERQIGFAREAVTQKYRDSFAFVHGWVSKWIDVEHAVERRIKSFKAPDEQLTPGALYVGVAGLFGSILARSRGLPSRIVLPPTLLILSLNHFLPKTAANVGEYVSDLEHTYVPRAAQFTDTAAAHSSATWEEAKARTAEAREALERAIVRGVDTLQETTGLKLREGLGFAHAASEDTVKKAEEQGKEMVKKVEEGAQEVKAIVEKKVEEVKRLV